MKGYAFIEFEEKDVAEIAAKTMNNYILFEKVLKCSVIEEASRYNLIFKKWKRKFKYNNKYEKYLKEKNKVKSNEELRDLVKLLLEKEEQKKNKLKEMGIKYDYPGFVKNFNKFRLQ
jgi:nucleolar protein 15